MLEVDIVRLDPGLELPRRAHPDDAGVDLSARTDVELAPGDRALVGTGIALAIPAGYAGFVHPRSGLAARRGLGLLNAPGTVDAGYRGEIRVCLVNHDPRETVTVRRGDRVAQLVVQRVERPVFREVAGLAASSRGDGGFGSTGTRSGAEPDRSTGTRSGAEPDGSTGTHREAGVRGPDTEGVVAGDGPEDRAEELAVEQVERA